MKLRLPFVIISMIILTLLISGCAKSDNMQPGQTPSPTQPRQPADTPEPRPAEDAQGNQTQAPDKELAASDELKALLPEREAYEWVYNGFAEYGHELEIEEIREENGRVVYKADGEVFDMSDGESDREYSLHVDFIVTSDSLIQEKRGKMMMDLFDNMVLIQTPLEKGHTWTQTVKEDGKEEVQLECTIEKVEDKDGVGAYTVLYQDQKSPYFERRVITEGVGVTEFTRLYIQKGQEGENYEISYWFYQEASGYDD